MIGRDKLGDHAAHGGADDMGALDAERVEHASRVICHVVEIVGGGRLLARRGRRHHGGQVGRTGLVELVRETHVAIVERDDAETALAEHVDQPLRPTCHLRAKAHDEQDGFAVARTVRLVFDADAIGVGLRHWTAPVFRSPYQR